MSLGLVVLTVVVGIIVNQRTEDTSVELRPTPTPAQWLATPTPRPPTPTPGPPTPTPEWTAVTATEILTRYGSNEIAGQQKYANRKLEVTGKIGRPDYAPYSGDTRYLISLHSDGFFTLMSLRCEIPVDDATTAWVAALVMGETVTVRGYIQDNMSGGILDLEACEPVAP